MKQLTKQEAYDLLMEGGEVNPGRWVSHSKYVAEATRRIAKQLGVDDERAEIYGYIHDIGRREMNSKFRHSIIGYQFLMEKGYLDEARICLTHSFINKDFTTTIGKVNATKEEYLFIKRYLESIEFNIYDKIIQLADSMALHSGFNLLERRLIDVYLRNGYNEQHMRVAIKLQVEIEEKMGCSLYRLFPEIKDTIDKNLIKDILEF